MRAIVSAVVLLSFTGGTSAAEDKFDAQNLIGKWERTNLKKDASQDSVVFELAENGKLTVHFTFRDKPSKIEGTYKLEGNKLDVEIPKLNFGSDAKMTYTVSEWTEDMLIWGFPNGDVEQKETWKKVIPK